MAKKKTSVLLPGSISDLVKGLQSGAQPNQNSREQQGDEAREEQHQREEAEQAESEGTAEQSATDQSESAAVDERPLSPTPDSADNNGYQQAESAEERGDDTSAVHEDRYHHDDQPVEQPSQRNGVIRPANVRNGAQPSRSASTAYMQGATNREDVPSRRGRRPKSEAGAEREYHVTRDDSKDSWQLFLDLAHDYKVGGGKLATIYIDETLKNVLDRLKYAGDEKLPTSAILSSIVARFFYDHEKDIKDVLFKNTLPW